MKAENVNMQETKEERMRRYVQQRAKIKLIKQQQK